MNLPEDFAGSAVWEWHDGSFDRVRFDLTATGWDVTGRRGDTRYAIRLDTDHAPVTLAATHGDHTLALRRTAAGWCDGDGSVIPGSARVRDLDLGWTAVTNSFPIRRLLSRRRAHGQFDVLTVDLPAFAIGIVRQRYDREGDFWRYANRDTGASARLAVDRNGLVQDYPELCHRKAAS